MEEIINKIIDLDNTAKTKIKGIKEKEDNIETYINEKLVLEKEKVDNKYLYKKKKLQEKYDLMFEEKKQQLEEKKQFEINKIKEKYENEKTSILEDLLSKII